MVFTLDSQSGPVEAKLLKMHRKKLIAQQDLTPCGLPITIRLRQGSVMVKSVPEHDLWGAFSGGAAVVSAIAAHAISACTGRPAP